MAIIISIVNNKGGVGKTTTTCNLADALGRIGKLVLVLDMDTQCNTTSVLMPRSKPIRNTLYELMDPREPDAPLSNFFYTTEYNNVFLLPNVPETASLEPSLIIEGQNSFFLLRNKLRNYTEQNFNYIIIDTPPNMGTFVMCALYASDFAIIPIKAGSAFSVEGLIKALDVINDIGANTNLDLKFLRLLVNYIDKRTAISRSIVDKLETLLGKTKAFKTLIPINTSFEKAEAMSRTVFWNDGTSVGARAFRELARELIAIFETEADHGRSTPKET